MRAGVGADHAVQTTSVHRGAYSPPYLAPVFGRNYLGEQTVVIVFVVAGGGDAYCVQ